MGRKLSMSQQSAHEAIKVNTFCVKKNSASRLRELILPLSTSEVTSGILPPVLGSPVQKGHGHTGVYPVCTSRTQRSRGFGASVI